MRASSPNSLWLRVLLPSVLIVVSGMGLSSRPFASAMRQARLSVQAADHKAAAAGFSAAAARIPYRADLWEQAGDQAVLAGDAAQAVSFYQHAQKLGKLSPAGYSAMGNAYASAGDAAAAVQTWQLQLEHFGPSPEPLRALAAAARVNGDISQAIEYWRSYIAELPADMDGYFQLGLLLAASQPELASAQLAAARQLDSGREAEIAILLDALRAAQFENPPAYLYTLSGQALGAVGAWDLAQIALQTATELDPTYAEAWALLGEASQHMGASGQVELEVAWALNPDSLTANLLLAIHWQRRNDYEQALFYMSRAAEIDPGNASIQADLGAMYLGSGDLDSALARYRQAVDLAPLQPEYWRLLAAFCVEHEIFLAEQALPAAERLVALENQNPENYVLLGRVHFLLLDDARGLQAFELALQLDMDFAPAHLYLALLLIRRGEMEDARRHLVLARDLDPIGQSGLFARQLLAQYFP